MADISIDRDSGGQDRDSYHYDQNSDSFTHESERTLQDTAQDATKLAKDAYEAILLMKAGHAILAADKSLDVAQDIVNLAPDMAGLVEKVIDSNVEARVESIKGGYAHYGDLGFQ